MKASKPEPIATRASETCPQLVDGECLVVAQLCGHPGYRPGRGVCAACCAQAAPRTANKVTADVAVHYLDQHFPSERQAAVARLEVLRRTGHVPSAPIVLGEGPGTELHRVLGWFKMKPERGCACLWRADYMNKRGSEWCAENLDTIVGWLHEEAKRRKMPVFSTVIARQIVRLAIRRARMKEQRSKVGHGSQT